jgi:hypothetical protein
LSNDLTDPECVIPITMVSDHDHGIPRAVSATLVSLGEVAYDAGPE